MREAITQIAYYLLVLFGGLKIKTMKVKLTKTNDEWRTLSATEQQQATVIGDAPFIPTVGKQFYVDSPSGNVKTSLIEEILPDGKFRTRNSIYRWEKL